MAGWIKMALGMEVGLGSGHIVLDRDPAPPKKGHSPSQIFGVYLLLDGGPASPSRKGGRDPPFSAHVCCCQTAGWIKMTLGMEVDLSPGHIVLDGDPVSPPQKSWHSPQFSAHFYCGQMARWFKMPLGMHVGLGPDNVVLDGSPAPPHQKGHGPQFLAHVYCG